MKPLYLEKVKRLESGWNRKFEELADVRKQAEELSATLGTHDAESLGQMFQEAQAFRGIFAPYQQQLTDANGLGHRLRGALSQRRSEAGC